MSRASHSGLAVALVLGAALGGCGDNAVTGDDDDGPEVPVDGASGAADATVDGAVIAGPRRLSTTGLYGDPASLTPAAGLLGFVPRYMLWSDGAIKRRWLYLPPGTTIDTSDPAHWVLPVGARLWKEFRAPDGTRLETRLIERVGDSGDHEVDYWMGAFVWGADQQDAVFVEDGAVDVLGTNHDVPNASQCRTCHQGEPGHALGLTTLQLSGPGDGTRLVDLAQAGALSTAVAPYAVPGDDVTTAALGVLHANCGHCHNPRGVARPSVDMDLQLDLDATTVEATTIWRATVGVPLFRFMREGFELRVAPGDPDASALLYRMAIRGAGQQMPPLATEIVDDVGVAAVRAWIAAMPPPVDAR